MERRKQSSESIIYTGSNLNHRTFKDDESWNSLQSTILSGHLSMDIDSEITEANENLTTVDEEDSILLKDFEEEENVLNINLDALSDEEVFFDCPSFVSSKSAEKSPDRAIVPLLRSPEQPSQHFLTVNIANLNSFTSTLDSGIEEEKTGALLVQVIEDFNDIKNHAQSTPKLNEIENRSISSMQNLANKNKEIKSKDGATNSSANEKEINNKRKLLFSTNKKKTSTFKQHLPIDKANKENFFNGKYSSAVNNVSKLNIKVKSPVDKRPRRVAQMKEFFENCNKTNNQSCGQKILTKASVKKIPPETLQSPKMLNANQSKSLNIYAQETLKLRNKSKSPKGPSYCTMETFKLSRTPKRVKTNNKPLTTRNSSSIRSLRPSSCSELSSTPSCSSYMSSDSLSLSSNKSKSTGNLSSKPIDAAKLMYAVEMNKITNRVYSNQRITLHKKPQEKRISKIMLRKSIGFTSSPVKPVKELRKMFSPSVIPTEKTKKVKATNKTMAAKTRIPQIIVSEVKKRQSN